MILSILLLPVLALAVDTWEPYPKGLSGFEVFGSRANFGASEELPRDYFLFTGPSYGLNESFHLSAFTGGILSEGFDTYDDFLSLVLFGNLYGGFTNPLKLDAWYQADVFGPWIDGTAHTVGLELNLDGEKAGAYTRPQMTWYRGEVGLPNGHLSSLFGIYYKVCRNAEILFDVTADAEDGSLMHTSTALGLNRILNDKLELILEARTQEPAEGEDRVWDLTLGVVAVW
jgi:hypothetical protein